MDSAKEIMAQSIVARKEVMRLMGFDLYSSLHFLEHLALRLLGATKTDVAASVDGVMPDGTKIEVKSAQVKRSREVYIFREVGSRNKQADVYILMVIEEWGCLTFMLHQKAVCITEGVMWRLSRRQSEKIGVVANGLLI